MEFSIISWNMNYWQRKPDQRIAAWDYLIDTISPDFAFLQEALPFENSLKNFNYVFPVVDSSLKWCSGIISKKLALEKINLVKKLGLPTEFQYSITATEVGLPDPSPLGNKPLTLISIYNNIHRLRGATGDLHILLSYLSPLILNKLGKREVVLGGDFNTSKQWDEAGKKWKGMSQDILFDRFEDMGLINCTWKMHKTFIHTYRHKKSNVAWQNDYFYVTKGLEKFVLGCDAISNAEIDNLSDHNPLVLKLRIP